MSRSLNKVQLIGNLTRDVEIRQTPTGATVATFSIATNRNWTQDGEKKEEAEYHRIVAWNKLAELCGQMLKKGTRCYVEGRISTRTYEKNGESKTTTEIVIDDMILFNAKGGE